MVPRLLWNISVGKTRLYAFSLVEHALRLLSPSSVWQVAPQALLVWLNSDLDAGQRFSFGGPRASTRSSITSTAVHRRKRPHASHAKQLAGTHAHRVGVEKMIKRRPVPPILVPDAAPFSPRRLVENRFPSTVVWGRFCRSLGTLSTRRLIPGYAGSTCGTVGNGRFSLWKRFSTDSVEFSTMESVPLNTRGLRRDDGCQVP